MNTTESTFQEYTMYYDNPIRVEGQVTIIGEHYVSENVWLPVPEESEETLALREKNRKDGEELASLVRDLDEECDRVHWANTQFRTYGRV